MGSEPLRAVEFYSGIGGWSYAAAEATAQLGVSVKVVAAFDVSTTCNSIYEANLGFRPSQRPIERLSVDDLDNLCADLWLMSPPCQPHTRQRNLPGSEGGGRDCEDPRAASFLHLCELLPLLRVPPRVLALENVVGFGTSTCAACWRTALRAAGFEVPHEWHLTPTMVGVPNERPRYYAAAVRHAGKKISVVTLDTTVSPKFDAAADLPISVVWPGRPPEEEPPALRPMSAYLELPATSHEELGNDQWLEPWRIPSSIIEKDAAWCFDIAVPYSSGEPTACFTHSYGRFARGTGSVLYVPRVRVDGRSGSEIDVTESSPTQAGPDARMDPESRAFGNCWRERLRRGGGDLRYFTPREVANLLGFPPARSNSSDTTIPSFALPTDLPANRAWAALGNSIHIGTAAAVIRFALVEALGIEEK